MQTGSVGRSAFTVQASSPACVCRSLWARAIHFGNIPVRCPALLYPVLPSHFCGNRAKSSSWLVVPLEPQNHPERDQVIHPTRDVWVLYSPLWTSVFKCQVATISKCSLVGSRTRILRVLMSTQEFEQCQYGSKSSQWQKTPTTSASSASANASSKFTVYPTK